MDPEIKRIFEASQSTSGKCSYSNLAIDLTLVIYNLILSVHFIVVKGNSHNLCKAGSKRRRAKMEIKYQKEAEELRLREVEEKMAQFDQMRQQLIFLQQQY